MENKFKIVEALALYTARSGQNCEKELAAKLWPNSRENTQITNMRNLKAGRTKVLDAYAITIICQTCKCEPNFLLGWGK